MRNYSRSTYSNNYGTVLIIPIDLFYGKIYKKYFLKPKSKDNLYFMFILHLLQKQSEIRRLMKQFCEDDMQLVKIRAVYKMRKFILYSHKITS